MYKKILMEIENNMGNIYFYSQLLTQVTGFSTANREDKFMLQLGW